MARTTALDLIRGAIRLIGKPSEAEQLSAEDADNALDSLNEMMEAWGLLRAAVHVLRQDLLTWPASQVTRTIGTGGNFNIERPLQLEPGCFTRDSDGRDYPLWLIREREEYDSIISKTQAQSGRPHILFFDPLFPLAKLYLYPVPDTQVTVAINHRQPLQEFVTLSDLLLMPPGYRKAIRYNLAVALSAEFSEPDLSPSVVETANESLANLQRLNQPRPMMMNRMAGLYGRGGRVSIRDY